MIKTDANLFRIVHAFVSDEETRYYLRGVYIEPCKAGGVTMTATDGQVLLSIHDAQGHADAPATVGHMDATILKACRVPAKEGWRELIVGDDGLASIKRYVYARDWRDNNETEAGAIAAGNSHDCRVKGTFPDWRRVVPRRPLTERDKRLAGGETAHPGWFRPALLARFCTAAKELPDDNNRPYLRIVETDSNTVALVLFTVTYAFGAIMPYRGDDRVELPEWA
jgi:hypothetical protein